ncbi:hydroxyacid dehydrogenase [Halococcus hamelinensis]|uniref:D-3-phosphoglycerate dehydrogenase n=1 Tax=Halococcus hamelinensis 100A6 TaxID=1132509 RepID=M0LXP9_9EURY|nr:hydroxyacid dehydrogenase [Halococcus hamelinensis]EMA38367.1 D-3-phosphoglycerate dehydrogenase [Halococcus hamelinensis 100A6]
MTTRSAFVDRDVQPVDRLVADLDGEFELTVGEPADEDALIEALSGMDAVFTTSRLTLSERVLEATSLDVVAKIGTGIDNVDLAAAERLGIPVTHTPGLNALSVAEHTVALLLAVARRIGQTQDLLRAGGWRDDAPFGTQLSGKTVGLVGFGNVGRRVATLLSGFRPTLLAYDPYVRPIDGELVGAELTSLDRVLTESDAVCVTAELTDETRGCIDGAALGSMKSSAFLVNTGRGPLVETDALVEAIREGNLAGAGLDVFEEEPLPADSPLHGLDNVVTTPHVAAMTTEYRRDGIDTLTENTMALLNGETVDPAYMAVDPARSE